MRLPTADPSIAERGQPVWRPWPPLDLRAIIRHEFAEVTLKEAA
jgi:hypothetical protein